jgi:hypothetical protein
MKKSVATAAFSRDFSQFKSTKNDLINEILAEFSDSLDHELLEDFFYAQIDDLRESLSAIDSIESERAGESPEEQEAAMGLCNNWVNNNLVNANDYTMVALTLWLHGPRHGKQMMHDADEEERKRQNEQRKGSE